MSTNWIYVCNRDDGIVVDLNDSVFVPLGGAIASFLGPETTEANVQEIARVAYTWSNTSARVIQNNLDATTSVFARIGGSDQTALDVQIGAGSTGYFEDTTGTVAVVDGDLINYRIDAGSGSHGDTITFETVAGHLQHESLERPMVVVTDPAGHWFVSQGATEFVAVVGGLNGGVTESRTQYVVRQNITFSNLRIVVAANNVDNASTFDLREDGASSTNLTISVGAGSTGGFEDTDSEVVSTGSSVNYRFVIGAGKVSDLIELAVAQMLQAGGTEGRLFGTANRDGIGAGVGSTVPFALESELSISDSEAAAQVTARAALAITDLFVLVVTNSLTTAAATFSFRVNGADSALSATVGAGSTGNFEDTNTAPVVDGDLINWQVSVAAGGSGALNFTILGAEMGHPDEMPWSQPPQGIERHLEVRAY